MQAISPENEPRPNTGKDSGYGAVAEPDGPQSEQKAGGWKKFALGLLAIGFIGCIVALILVFTGKGQEEDKTELFEQYIKQFNKEYSSSELKQQRYEAFVDNLEKIKELNLKNKLAQFGWTKFSDLSEAEFATNFLNAHVQDPTRRLDARRSQNLKTRQRTNAKQGVQYSDWTSSSYTGDYPKVTPVRDQGWCGSCWAFSAVQAIESRYLIEFGDAQGHDADSVEDFGLAVQQMVSCDEENWGCNGGDLPDAFDYVVDAGGLSTEDNYPYMSGSQGETRQCKENMIQVLENTAPTAQIYATEPCWQYWDCPNQDEEALAETLDAEGPVAICVNASPWQNYQSGVLEDGGMNGYYNLNHCVLLTGLGSNNNEGSYWMVKNTWSTGWGEDGYIRLKYGDNVSGMADEALYVTLS